jgi:hypothetical protein
MPSPFLTFKERERLTRFPDDIQHWDLITYCTLTEHDCSLIDTYQGDATVWEQRSSSVPCAISVFAQAISRPRPVT